MNKLTRFTVQGFQSINGRFSIDFEGITILCGPNSAGKSSLIDALRQSRQWLKDTLLNSQSHFVGHWHYCGGFLSSHNLKLEIAINQIKTDTFFLDDHISKFLASGPPPAVIDILHDWIGMKLTLNQTLTGVGIQVDGESLLHLASAQEVEDLHSWASDSDTNERWWSVDTILIPEGSAIHPKTKRIETIQGNPRFIDLDASDDELVHYGGEAIFIEISDGLKRRIDSAMELGSIPDFCARNQTLLLIGPVSEGEYLPLGGYDNEFYRIVSELIRGVVALTLDCDWPLVCPDDRRILNTRETFYGDDESDQNKGVDQVSRILLDYCKEYDPEVIKIPRGGRGTPPDFSHSFVNRALSKLDDGISKYRIVTEVITNSSEFVGSTQRVDPYYALDLKKRYRLWVQTEELYDHVIVRGFEDVGSGLSYVFPVLATLDVANIALVQQPELHLHPAAQCELGDILIEALSKGTGCVVETHSEHLILRILRRIREAASTDRECTVSPENVSILYFEPKDDGTRVHRIRVSDDGDFLDPWPRGFFSERGRELFPDEFLQS